MHKKTLFSELTERIIELTNKTPLPFWMRGEKLPEQDEEQLSDLSQLEYGITRDLTLKGINSDSPQGRKETARVLRQIRKNYNWLS